jgi:hypothetical protein
MQNAARYREFAETLIAAAQDFPPDTREVIQAAAQAWVALADAEDRAAAGETNVVSLVHERQMRRRG